LIRCSPGEDRTNGFFVACFVRIGYTLDTEPPGAALKLPLKRSAEDAIRPPYDIQMLTAEQGTKRKRKRGKRSEDAGAVPEEWAGIAD